MTVMGDDPMKTMGRGVRALALELPQAVYRSVAELWAAVEQHVARLTAERVDHGPYADGMDEHDQLREAAIEIRRLTAKRDYWRNSYEGAIEANRQDGDGVDEHVARLTAERDALRAENVDLHTRTEIERNLLTAERDALAEAVKHQRHALARLGFYDDDDDLTEDGL